MSTPRSIAEVRAALDPQLAPPAQEWLADALARVAADPSRLEVVSPAVGRRVGRGPLDPSQGTDDVHGWSVDDAARVLLIAAAGDAVDPKALYRGGDAAERRAVLRAIGIVEGIGRPVAQWLIDDAVRTNDPRLIAAALGPWAIRELSADDLAQAVLKCAFVGIPLGGLPGLPARATPELARMLAAFAHERVAAGRDVPPDAWPLIASHPPDEELRRIDAERAHPTPDRSAAADRAWAAYQAAATTTERAR